jgi:ferredoxin, 2Fe-2S
MIKLTFIDASGEAHVVEAKPGYSVMENAVKNNVPGIAADCGGALACATCRVYVSDEWQARLQPATEMERSTIEFSEDTTPGLRLSCQIKVTPELDGLLVRTPESQH